MDLLKADATLAIKVKVHDIDAAGIVHNSVYILWLEDLRHALIDKVECMEDGMHQGYMPVLTRTEINYKRAIKFAHKVTGYIWLTKVGKVKWGISAEFYVNGELVADGQQEGCMVDVKTHRPIPMPEPFKIYWQIRHLPSAMHS